MSETTTEPTAIRNRIAEIVKNYEDHFLPQYVPDKIAAALLVEFDISPKRMNPAAVVDGGKA